MRILPLAFALACAPPARDPADRTPATAACDETDPNRCHLPWPSNTFARTDETSATGLRLAIDSAGMKVPEDPGLLNRADGFSRLTGVAASFRADVADEAASWDPAMSLEALAPLQVITIQADHPKYGTRRPFRTEVVHGRDAEGPLALLVGRPTELLPENADHAMVVLDTAGVDEAAPRAVRVAVGLEKPQTAREQALANAYGPVADALVEAGVPLERILRVSWFTTRSQADTTRKVKAMIAENLAAESQIQVVIDQVAAHRDPAVAMVVRGRLTGAPAFLDEVGHFVLDAAGDPVVSGTRDVPFRAVIPAGEGDYRFALYGHGTGGDVTDDAFDAELARAGIAKVNVRFDGWTGDELLPNLLGFTRMIDGSGRAVSKPAQAVAAGPLLLSALAGELGDVLSAADLGGAPNPAAGRRPDMDTPAWLGGSLGGTMGAVIVGAEPRLRVAALNVPGSGWSHMIPHSHLYDLALESLLKLNYGDDVDIHHGLLMVQGNLDDIDGGVWAEEVLAHGTPVLLQQSMGDPVLPNLGTELLAASFGAVQLDPPLQPILGLQVAAGPIPAGVVLAQYRVPDEGPYAVHGFAARDSEAGRAAIGQITGLVTSAWAGEPAVDLPAACLAHPGCDFVR
jgi:hypothetical protein